jgi:hypothetical protein
MTMIVWRRLLIVWLTCVIGALSPPRTMAQTKVDLALVLAVDISFSMDLEELKVQRAGYTAALRDPDIQRVILSGAHRRIAVSYFEWAGVTTQVLLADWTLLDSPAAINALADRLDAAPISRDRRTSISGALDYAGGLFARSPYSAERLVIDVSGDGPNNQGRHITVSRDALLDRGIVINGLPIILKRGNPIFDLPDLDLYYETCVIGGPGSFAIAIREQAEFAPAIRRKLLQEIADLPLPPKPGRLIRAQIQHDATDCSIGESIWRRFMDGRFGP